VRRRDFITLLGGAATAWPLAAQAQQTDQIRRIGLLMIVPEGDSQSRADRDALGSGLHELGWITGRNVDLEYRWSDGDEPLLRKYAAELVGRSPDVLMTEGTAALAAVKRETKNIPTIFVNVSDPVGQGFVASLAHPGGNTTGFTLFEFSMGTKWVEILRELAPTTKHIGFLFNRVGYIFFHRKSRLCFFKQYGLLRKISKSMSSAAPHRHCSQSLPFGCPLESDQCCDAFLLERYEKCGVRTARRSPIPGSTRPQ